MIPRVSPPRSQRKVGFSGPDSARPSTAAAASTATTPRTPRGRTGPSSPTRGQSPTSPRRSPRTPRAPPGKDTQRGSRNLATPKGTRRVVGVVGAADGTGGPSEGKLHRAPKVVPPQVVIERVPRHMAMHAGNVYFVPAAVATLRLDVEWTRIGRPPLDVEVSAVLLNHALKRWDYVTSQRKVSRDRNVTYVGDEALPPGGLFGRRESIQLKLAAISPEVAHIAVVVSVKTANKTLADLVGPSVAIVDTAHFPGTPELMRYTFAADENFFPGAVMLVFSAEADSPNTTTAAAAANTTTASVAVGGPLSPASSSTGAAPARLWTAHAVGMPVLGRGFRHVSDESEALVSRMVLEGWRIAEPTGERFGGDSSRVAVQRVLQRADAEELALLTGAPPPALLMPPPSSAGAASRRGTNARVSTQDGDREDEAADPPPLETESDTASSASEDSLKLYYISQGVPTLTPPETLDENLRPRVVRKGRSRYTVGTSLPPPSDDSDNNTSPTNLANGSAGGGSGADFTTATPVVDGGSDEEDLFRIAFPHFSAPHVTRYDGDTYNVGCAKPALVQHFAAHRETYDAAICAALRVPRRPIDVGFASKALVCEQPAAAPHVTKPALPPAMQQQVEAHRRQTLARLTAALPKPKGKGKRKLGVRPVRKATPNASTAANSSAAAGTGSGSGSRSASRTARSPRGGSTPTSPKKSAPTPTTGTSARSGQIPARATTAAGSGGGGDLQQKKTVVSLQQHQLASPATVPASASVTALPSPLPRPPRTPATPNKLPDIRGTPHYM